MGSGLKLPVLELLLCFTSQSSLRRLLCVCVANWWWCHLSCVLPSATHSLAARQSSSPCYLHGNKGIVTGWAAFLASLFFFISFLISLHPSAGRPQALTLATTLLLFCLLKRGSKRHRKSPWEQRTFPSCQIQTEENIRMIYNFCIMETSNFHHVFLFLKIYSLHEQRFE